MCWLRLVQIPTPHISAAKIPTSTAFDFLAPRLHRDSSAMLLFLPESTVWGVFFTHFSYPVYALHIFARYFRYCQADVYMLCSFVSAVSILLAYLSETCSDIMFFCQSAVLSTGTILLPLLEVSVFISLSPIEGAYHAGAPLFVIKMIARCICQIALYTSA